MATGGQLSDYAHGEPKTQANPGFCGKDAEYNPKGGLQKPSELKDTGNKLGQEKCKNIIELAARVKNKNRNSKTFVEMAEYCQITYRQGAVSRGGMCSAELDAAKSMGVRSKMIEELAGKSKLDSIAQANVIKAQKANLDTANLGMSSALDKAKKFQDSHDYQNGFLQVNALKRLKKICKETETNVKWRGNQSNQNSTIKSSLSVHADAETAANIKVEKDIIDSCPKIQSDLEHSQSDNEATLRKVMEANQKLKVARDQTVDFSKKMEGVYYKMTGISNDAEIKQMADKDASKYLKELPADQQRELLAKDIQYKLNQPELRPEDPRPDYSYKKLLYEDELYSNKNTEKLIAMAEQEKTKGIFLSEAASGQNDTVTTSLQNDWQTEIKGKSFKDEIAERGVTLDDATTAAKTGVKAVTRGTARAVASWGMAIWDGSDYAVEGLGRTYYNSNPDANWTNYQSRVFSNVRGIGDWQGVADIVYPDVEKTASGIFSWSNPPSKTIEVSKGD